MVLICTFLIWMRLSNYSYTSEPREFFSVNCLLIFFAFFSTGLSVFCSSAHTRKWGFCVWLNRIVKDQAAVNHRLMGAGTAAGRPVRGLLSCSRWKKMVAGVTNIETEMVRGSQTQGNIVKLMLTEGLLCMRHCGDGCICTFIVLSQ